VWGTSTPLVTLLDYFFGVRSYFDVSKFCIIIAAIIAVESFVALSQSINSSIDSGV